MLDWSQTYVITQQLAEDRVWSLDLVPKLASLPKNVFDIWQFCFTEMFNNAIDHSGGSQINVSVRMTGTMTTVTIEDNGVGIFCKIQKAMHLLDERHAVLELEKGKLTTDPVRHTGQSIFFASRLVDRIGIMSGEVLYAYAADDKIDWIANPREPFVGTAVFLWLSNFSPRIDKEVFDEYSSGEDYAFTKTVVRVALARFGDEKLVSRSQAKRLLARIDQFKSVWFDFTGIETIGQAFADEIFRVFANAHPNIEVVGMRANPALQGIINFAQSGRILKTIAPSPPSPSGY